MPPLPRKPKGDKTEFTSAGGLIWTILLLGLCFCLVDTFYLFYLHHFQDAAQLQADVSGILHQRKEQQQFKSDIQAYLQRRKNGLTTSHALTVGKEQIISILKEAGVNNLDDATIELLPTWQAVVDIYGSEPKVFGLETCATFQSTIPPAESFLAPAGAFNSGTNLLAELLVANCHLPARQRKYGMKNMGVRWQVNWGKHQSPKWRLNHDVTEDNVVPNENILPVVTIRDPYLWMQSMCRHRYAAHWFHPPGHCPNLVANEVDYEFLKYAESGAYTDMEEYHHKDAWLMDNVLNMANFTSDQAIVPLYVKYNRETTNHLSLAHLWSDWYHEYTNGDFPKLIIRFEDLLFFGKEVTEKACKCAGGEMYPRFRHIGNSAKKGTIHGDDKTSLVDALIRYGQRQNVTRGMTTDDIEYAKTAFADDLMKFFAYKHPGE
jgi:hypothetical protein